MTTKSTTTRKANRLAAQIDPQVDQLERQYKMTHPQKVLAYNALIEILQGKQWDNNSDYIKILLRNRLNRNKSAKRILMFMDALAGLIVDTVKARRAA